MRQRRSPAGEDVRLELDPVAVEQAALYVVPSHATTDRLALVEDAVLAARDGAKSRRHFRTVPLLSAQVDALGRDCGLPVTSVPNFVSVVGHEEPRMSEL